MSASWTPPAGGKPSWPKPSGKPSSPEEDCGDEFPVEISSTPASPVKPSSSVPVISLKPSGKPTWPEGDCETKTYDTTVTDVITETITVTKGGNSWPELTTTTLTSTKKITVTIPRSKASETAYVPVPKPSAPGKPESPYVQAPKPVTSAAPEVPYKPSYTKKTTAAPVATGGSYVKPSGSYEKPSATTKGYKPVMATANAAVKNGAAGAGMIAAAMLALF